MECNLSVNKYRLDSIVAVHNYYSAFNTYVADRDLSPEEKQSVGRSEFIALGYMEGASGHSDRGEDASRRVLDRSL